MTAWLRGFISFVPIAAACGVVRAQPLEIVSPRADQILYGRTDVQVRGPLDATFELSVRRGPDQESEPICTTHGPPAPGACQFDAWRDLSSETVIARLRDRDGRLIDEQRVQTRELLEPDTTVEAAQRIAIQASVSGENAWVESLVAHPETIACRLGGKPCRVTRVERIALRGRLNVGVLIDESASVSTPGLHLDLALARLGDSLRAAADPTAGIEVRFRLTAFAGVTRPLTDGFVTAMPAIEKALTTLRPEGSTALYRSISTELESLVELRQRDRVAGREDGYALIVVSDGNDTSNGILPGAALLRLATGGGIPIFCLILPAGGNEQAFRALGPLSGGASYVATAYPERLLGGDLFERLRARVLLEIEPPSDLRFSMERGLALEPPHGGALSYPMRARPEPTPREIAVSMMTDRDLPESDRIAALRRVAADGRGVDEVEAIYQQLHAATRDKPESRAWRSAAFDTVAELAGHALLWRGSADTVRFQMLRCLERTRDEHWFGESPPALLRSVLDTVLDPDFPASHELRARVSALQRSL